MQQNKVLKSNAWDSPGGPVAKTPHFQFRGHVFTPSSGNQIPDLVLCKLIN